MRGFLVQDQELDLMTLVDPFLLRKLYDSTKQNKANPQRYLN